jgi:hypothetical protein
VKSKQRQKLSDLASERLQQMQTLRSPEKTGKEELEVALGINLEDENSIKHKTESKKMVLYLKEGLKGVETNWTKYPNEMHDLMAKRLTEFESILYIKLWRASWGYGRNYCRLGHTTVIKETAIKSMSTARRATNGLKSKRFIITALNGNGTPNITKVGTLYRVCTPNEIIANMVEEGIVLEDIPIEGVFCENIVTENTVLKEHVNMFPQNTVRKNSVPIEQTMVSCGNMVTQNMVSENADSLMSNDNSALCDYVLTEHPLKEDIKDNLNLKEKKTLSPRDICTLFYKGIGQEKISKQKRERAEINIKKLLEEGFTLEDIQYAIKWTLENAKEELYDFSIINHTIGQAMAEKGKVEKKEIKNLEREKMLAQKQVEEEKQEKLLERVKEYKNNLNNNQRKQLREESLNAIRNTKGIREEFITEILIEAKENEIITAKLGINSLET